MNKRRERQYKRKFDAIYNGLKLLSEWLIPISLEEFLSDTKTRYASYKAFQEVVEALMDICAMIVKDIGEEPKDDYTNIETLVEHKVIPSRLKDVLVSANSLRNWIIHKYNKLNDTIAYERMVDMFDVLRELVEELINWLSKS